MQESITSHAGREYRLRVHIPEVDPPADGHPLLWLLDAPTTWAPMQHALRAPGAGDAVVVGIDWPGEGKVDPGLRRRDFTRPALHPPPPPRGNADGWTHDGDCAAFLTFLLQQLQPIALDELPVDGARQTLVGHSLSGLFVLQSLFDAADAFAGRVAASPSIWWDQARILSDLEAIEALQGPATTLITVGSGEQVAGPEKPPEVEGEDAAALLGEPHMVDYAAVFAQELRARGGACEFRVFEGETHHSVLPAAMADALAFACGSR